MMRTSTRGNLQYLAYKATVTFKARSTKSEKSAETVSGAVFQVI